MNATDSTVKLLPRADGSTGIHDYRTGRLLGVLPACATEFEPAPETLQNQIETVTIRRARERREEITCGMMLGIAFVAGVAVGALLSYL